MGDTVIQIALSVFGMVGGPVCGVVTLALFFPCCNAIVSTQFKCNRQQAAHPDRTQFNESFYKLIFQSSMHFFSQGAFCGLLVSLTLTTWIGFGAILSDIPVPTRPLSTEGCGPSVNDTITASTALYTEQFTESQPPE